MISYLILSEIVSIAIAISAVISLIIFDLYQIEKTIAHIENERGRGL